MNSLYVHTVSLTLPSQEAKMGGLLAPILGAYGVNIVKFCKDFNDLSIIYQKGLSIRLFLFIKSNNDFIIKLKGLSSTYLFSLICNNNNEINYLEIYKIALILQSQKDVASLKSICLNLFATLSSTSYLIKYE